MRAAIMQPTYLPWCGYFALMRSVDCFVVLDNVQFDKRSWQQRNRIKSAHGTQWLTVPVLSKGRRDQKLSAAEIDRSRRFPETHRRSLELCYGKAPFFEHYAQSLFDVLARRHDMLVELSIELIAVLRQALGVATPMLRASFLSAGGTKAGLLANICVEIGADHYVSPPSAAAYLAASDELQSKGVALSYFAYDHPVYEQRFGAFEPYLSVVDLLFNVGPAAGSLLGAGAQQEDAADVA